MKKIGKKLSYVTKVLLVIGLIISNLSSLSIVFAYEVDADQQLDVVGNQLDANEQLDVVDDQLDVNEQLEVGTLIELDASIDDENKITISYAGDINDTDELMIEISEKYTYSNCTVTDSVSTCEITANVSYNLEEADRDLLLGEALLKEYNPSVLAQPKFDGVYEIVVSLINVTEDNALLAEKQVTNKNVTFDQGIEFKIYDESDTIIDETDGKYVVNLGTTLVKVIGKMLPGGISPNDEFIYGEEVYDAYQILDLGFENMIDFSNHLYGEYKLPVTITYAKNDEEISYIEHFNILYGTYEDNAVVINGYTDSSKVVFDGSSKDGSVYVYLGEDLVTINDLYQAIEQAYLSNDDITYIISNDEYSYQDGGILSGYDSSFETLEEYLSKISVDASTIVSITDGVMTITFQALVVGDIDGDNILDENDIIALINQLVGNEELDATSGNIYDLDDDVTILDVMKLDQIVKTGAWDISLNEEEIELDAKLEFVNNEIEITSGDEFEVNYILNTSDYDINGIAGTVEYDNTKLELVSITENVDFIGSDKDGKFIYVSTSYKNSTSASQIDNVDSDDEITFLVLKFRALAGGTSTITLANPEYFDQDTYYQIVEIDDTTGESNPTTKVISLDVTVSESSDNTLSSLMIGDDVIELVDGVYDYKLVVSNDVKTVNVQALLSNVAASISSIVAPEELAIGDNTITITVASESGDEITYTIIVTREEAVEQVNNNVGQANYQNNTANNSVNNKPQDPPKVNPDVDNNPEPEEKTSNLSKIIIIVLIVLVIGGLIYLIFKDDGDDESKKANKEIKKFKDDDFDLPSDKNVKNNNKKNQNKNNKKER